VFSLSIVGGDRIPANVLILRLRRCNTRRFFVLLCRVRNESTPTGEERSSRDLSLMAQLWIAWICTVNKVCK